MQCKNHAISKYDLKNSHTERNLQEFLIGELPHFGSDPSCKVTKATCEKEKKLIQKYIPAGQICYSGDQIAKQLKKNFSRKIPSSVDIVLKKKQSGEYVLADCKYGCAGNKVFTGKSFYKKVVRKFLFSELFMKSNGLPFTEKRILIFNADVKDIATNTLYDLCLEQDFDKNNFKKYKVMGTEEFSRLCEN